MINGVFFYPLPIDSTAQDFSRVRTFVTKWFIVDEERGWVIAEFDNIWDDPGNGKVFSFRNYTLMKYAGDGCSLNLITDS